nr:hypothetical protein [Tanacetum cinerariifolium]
YHARSSGSCSQTRGSVSYLDKVFYQYGLESWLKNDAIEISQTARKGIATKSEKDPSKKLVPASTIIRPDHDELVRVEFMINVKIIYLAEQEIQEYWDKEDKMKKSAKESKLLAMSRPEVIKVIRKEAQN